MTDTDPTMDLMAALNRADPSEWSRIVYGMPIFVEHDGYEVDDGQDKDGKPVKKLVVVPFGDAPPTNAKKIYTVDKARLEAITGEINKNLATGGKPIKLFIGHSDPKKPQAEQPALAGFGRGAYMGTFGPANRTAIKTDAFFKHGHENAAAEYPERSPEFLPRTNAITGVALLKTDPRLPMGMLAYSDDHEIVYYGLGFLNAQPEAKGAGDSDNKPDPVMESGHAARTASTVARDASAKAHADGGSPNAHMSAVRGEQASYREAGNGKDSATPLFDHPEAAKHHAEAGKIHRDDARQMRACGKPAAVHAQAADANENAEELHRKAHGLSGGAVRYADDGTTKELADKPPVGTPAKPDPDANDADADTEAVEKPDTAAEVKDTGTDTADDDDEFGPHEVKFAGRLMKHLETNHPAIKYMFGEYKKYADTQAAMVAPSATDGFPPIGQPKKPTTAQPDEERINMADTTTKTPGDNAVLLARIAALEADAVQEKERIKALEHDKAVLYAEQETSKLVNMGIKIADPVKFKAKLVAGTPEQRLEQITDARINYAREDRAPTGDFLPLNKDASGLVEGPQRTEADLEPEEVSEVIQYAESNGIDASTPAGWKKAMTAVFGEKKKSA